MKRKWILGAFAVVGLTTLGGMHVMATSSIPQRSVLSGTVHTVVTEGAKVTEGDTLVTVDTMAGPVPAVRADVDGVVQEVKVAPGDQIASQEIIVVVVAK